MPFLLNCVGQSSTVIVAVIVPIFVIASIGIAVVLIILLVVFFRRKSSVKSFQFEQMTHKELEEKDLENYLATEHGALPSMRAGAIMGSGEEEGDEGGGKEFDDVDLKNPNGYLV